MSADKPWKIIGIDPSSTITGYAVLDGIEASNLVEAGVIHGRVSKQSRALISDVGVQRQLIDLPALERTLSMVPDVDRLISEHAPCHVVVEMPSGKAGTGSKHGASGSLTSYGMAAGLLFATCNVALASKESTPGVYATSIPVSERVWTKDQSDKLLRGRMIGTMYGWKHPSEWYEDAVNLNITDAIGIARWAIINGIVVDRAIVQQYRNASQRRQERHDLWESSTAPHASELLGCVKDLPVTKWGKGCGDGDCGLPEHLHKNLTVRLEVAQQWMDAAGVAGINQDYGIIQGWLKDDVTDLGRYIKSRACDPESPMTRAFLEELLFFTVLGYETACSIRCAGCLQAK